MGGLVVLAVLVALGLATVLGVTRDSRDPRYGVGPLLASRIPRLLDDEEVRPGDCGDRAREATVTVSTQGHSC